MKNALLKLVLLALLLTVPSVAARANTVSSSARGNANAGCKARAAFLLNVLKFVEWPRTSFQSADSPIVLGIVGRDSVDSCLEPLVRGRFINGRSVVVKRIENDSEIQKLHMLYFTHSKRYRVSRLLRALQNKDILTVGDEEWFFASGGMVCFRVKNNAPVFEINSVAVSRSRLRISSKLLGIARAGGRYVRERR